MNDTPHKRALALHHEMEPLYSQPKSWFGFLAATNHTAIGIRFGELLGGAVLVETVFAWPGLGSLLYNAIVARDYTLIQGSALLIALGFVLINLMVDLLYTVINPTLQD